jgi:hypothetical protein
MHRLTIVTLASLVVAIPATSPAQDVQSIMDTMRKKQLERWEGVDNYFVDKTIMGNHTQMKFQRVPVTGVEGDTYDIFRLTMPDEDPCRAAAPEGSVENMTPEQLEQAAAAMEMSGQVMGDHIESEMSAMGVPTFLLTGGSATPWASMDPRHMFGAGAAMYRGAAEAKRAREIERAMPDTFTADMAGFAQSAKLVGTETIDGREAFHLRAEGVNITQAQDDYEFTMENSSMWIDTEHYVPLRMVMEGSMTRPEGTKPVRLEQRELDYRQVPDSNMYESYRQVMTMSGILSEEEQAQMREAQQQMAELETQLAQMPPGQRDMIMAQMGPQMEAMKGMANSGGMEITTQVNNFIVNFCDKQDQVNATTAIGPMRVPMGEMASIPTATAPPGGGADGSAGSVATVPPSGSWDDAINTTVPPSGPSGGSSDALTTAGVAAAGVAGIAIPGGDDVEVLPYYVDEEGLGVIRYSEPKGQAFLYHMSISGLTGNADRPREVIVGQMGPYPGPDVGIYIGSLNMIGVPLDQIEIELYELEPYRPVVRFRPVVDPEQAEGMAGCGTVSATGACSNTIAQ